MDIRKVLNGSPLVVIVLVLVVLGVCGWIVSGQLKQGTKPPQSGYYTIDDGKTWFVESDKKLAPFDYQGKPAVRVRMFRCTDNKEMFVGYLERYTTKGKAVFEKYKAEQAAMPGKMPPSFGEFTSLGQAVLEFKKPGDTAWAVGGTPQATAISHVTCKDGSVAFVAEAD